MSAVKTPRQVGHVESLTGISKKTNAPSFGATHIHSSVTKRCLKMFEIWVFKIKDNYLFERPKI
jgi:hypothetical protein